jgi:cytochrome c-type biogenesis protein CcmF
MLLQRGKGRFRRLNLVLATTTFLLVVYATFLTRSGVLADFSVHSFVDLGITGWLVFNMVFFLLMSIGLLAYRWREIPAEVGDEPFMSRTIFFVVCILLTILIGLVVLFGTSAPLISRLWGAPAQVGPDFYNRMGFWLAVIFALFLGGTPFLGWNRFRKGAGRIFVTSLIITAALVAVALAFGLRGVPATIYIAAALFCITTNLWATIDYGKSGRWRMAGGPVAHIGLGLMLLAFLTTGWFGNQHKVRLAEGKPAEVLGYTLTFRGVEKPTPQARDAMVVEVTSPRGQNFVLKPRMWVNQKTNQLIANPDIKAFFTKDLYVAPVEFDPGKDAPVSGRLMLPKDQPVAFRDWTLTFRGFDMCLERPDAEPVVLEPSIVSTEDGAQPIAVDIPGVPGGKLRPAGMSVDQGIVRVEIVGLGGGIARTVVLAKGETLTYNGLDITFDDFDMSDFDPEAGKINFGVMFNVETGGRQIEVMPTYRGGMGGEPVITSAVVPGSGGISLSPGQIDAEGGTVELQVYDPSLAPEGATPASVVLDVSTKPLISLVWIGTILIIFGIGMAMVLRRKDIDTIPVEG